MMGSISRISGIRRKIKGEKTENCENCSFEDEGERCTYLKE